MQRFNFTLNLPTIVLVSIESIMLLHILKCILKFTHSVPQILENEDLSSSVGAAGRKPAIMAAETTKSALIFGFVKSFQKILEHLPLILSTP